MSDSGYLLQPTDWRRTRLDALLSQAKARVADLEAHQRMGRRVAPGDLADSKARVEQLRRELAELTGKETQ